MRGQKQDVKRVGRVGAMLALVVAGGMGGCRTNVQVTDQWQVVYIEPTTVLDLYPAPAVSGGGGEAGSTEAGVMEIDNWGPVRLYVRIPSEARQNIAHRTLDAGKMASVQMEGVDRIRLKNGSDREGIVNVRMAPLNMERSGFRERGAAPMPSGSAR